MLWKRPVWPSGVISSLLNSSSSATGIDRLALGGFVQIFSEVAQFARGLA